MDLFGLLRAKKPSWLSIPLTVVCLFLLVSTNVASAVSCNEVFRFHSDSLRVDNRYPQIKLYQDKYFYKKLYVEDVLMGYEFLQSAPIFKNPELFREYINENPIPRKSEMETQFLGKSVGHISFEVGRERFMELHGVDPYVKVPQPTKEEVFAKIKQHVPQPFYDELKVYVEAVLNDAQKRNYKFAILTMTMRTEKYPDGFPQGHSHALGDLNYVRAEIGPNTEIDFKNRQNPENILESDYISLTNPESTAVFGGVWHRTPPMKDNQKRLLILLEFQPQ